MYKKRFLEMNSRDVFPPYYNDTFGFSLHTFLLKHESEETIITNIVFENNMDVLKSFFFSNLLLATGMKDSLPCTMVGHTVP